MKRLLLAVLLVSSACAGVPKQFEVALTEEGIACSNRCHDIYAQCLETKRSTGVERWCVERFNACMPGCEGAREVAASAEAVDPFPRR